MRIHNMARVFAKYEADYTLYRFTIVNGPAGETKTELLPATIRAYIHPDDYKAVTYNQQGDRLEDRVKIFVRNGVDIIDDDEVIYQSKRYRVMRDSARIVGNYKKLIAELVR
jgi:hypothetical protein